MTPEPGRAGSSTSCVSACQRQDRRLLQARCRAYGDVEPFFPFVEMCVARSAVRAWFLFLSSLVDAPAWWGRRAERGAKADVADSAEIVARIRALDASLEPFIPLYLHLLSVPSESHALPRHLQGEHLQAALLDALSAIFTAWPATHPGRAARRLALGGRRIAAALRRMREIAPPTALVHRHDAAGASVLDEWPAEDGCRSNHLISPPRRRSSRRARCRPRVGQLARRVFERTGGNPFFLEQVCRALIEQGAVRRATARPSSTVDEALSLPDTVQAVIRTRLDNLEPRAREVLRVAAAFGRDFEHTLVAEAIGETSTSSRPLPGSGRPA